MENSWKLSHTLNLAADISVNLVVSKASLASFDLNTVYILTETDIYEGNTKVGTKTETLLPEERGEYYYFTLQGLTAVNMNDSIRSVLYGSRDGQVYYSATDHYSIADYAYSQLKKTATSKSLKTLCADLLRYGTKAQIFKGYRTDSLVDRAMTDSQRAYLSDIEAVTFGNTDKVLGDMPNAPILWKGKALNLESKIALKFVFTLGSYTGSLSGLCLKISYKDIGGEEKTLILENPEVYNSEKGYYAFTLDCLLAAELRTVVSAQIFAGTAALSPTLQYSPDTYGNNKKDTLLELCKALFAYSDSAKAYFVN